MLALLLWVLLGASLLGLAIEIRAKYRAAQHIADDSTSRRNDYQIRERINQRIAQGLSPTPLSQSPSRNEDL